MPTHTMPALRVVASACACGLVIASAGFGAVFAWQIGIQHGIVLAPLTVLFGVALEGIKPLAISAALQAFGSWSLVCGLALLALGTIAIAYSLTSELSLMAGSRGDVTAKREQASDASQRARESHQRAKTELSTLKASRPIGETRPNRRHVLDDCVGRLRLLQTSPRRLAVSDRGVLRCGDAHKYGGSNRCDG